MRLKALKAAFPSTLPIFTGFWFLGMASVLRNFYAGEI